MNGLLLVIILNFCTVIITILTADIFKRKTNHARQIFRANSKRVVPYKSIGVILVSVISGYIATRQYLIEQKEETKNKSTEAIIRRISDSLAEARIEKSKNETIGALAKYSLQYDSAQQRIEKLVKDSAGRKISIVQGNAPEFGFCPPDGIAIIDSTTAGVDFALKFCNKQAIASNIDITCYVVVQDLLRGYKYETSVRPISKNTSIRADIAHSFPIRVPVDQLQQMNRFFVYLKGTYTNIDKSGSYPVDEIVLFDWPRRKFGVETPYVREKVLEALKQAGIKL